MSATVLLLPDTTSVLNPVGVPVRVGAFNNFYTVVIYVNNFTGSVYIEASLAQEPTDEDFFPIFLNGNIPYASFPQNPAHPTGYPGLSGRGGYQDTNLNTPYGDTGVYSWTFEVNALWMRARVDRSFVQPPPTNIYQIEAFGNVEQILLGYQ
jgi:hypothetical protein